MNLHRSATTLTLPLINHRTHGSAWPPCKAEAVEQILKFQMLAYKHSPSQAILNQRGKITEQSLCFHYKSKINPLIMVIMALLVKMKAIFTTLCADWSLSSYDLN